MSKFTKAYLSIHGIAINKDEAPMELNLCIITLDKEKFWLRINLHDIVGVFSSVYSYFSGNQLLIWQLTLIQRQSCCKKLSIVIIRCELILRQKLSINILNALDLTILPHHSLINTPLLVQDKCVSKRHVFDPCNLRRHPLSITSFTSASARRVYDSCSCVSPPLSNS